MAEFAEHRQKSILSFVASSASLNARGKVHKKQQGIKGSCTVKDQVKHVQMHLDLGQVMLIVVLFTCISL